MKVLTFCAYYEPEIAASMYLLTNLFEDAANSGIEVELYAPTPTRGVNLDTVKAYRKKKDEKLCNNKLHIHRFSMMQEGKNTIGRAIRYVLINGAFLWKGLRSNADVVFVDSTPPTQGLVVAILKKLKRIPVVYNLQDIFPDSLVHTGMCSEQSVFYKIGSWIERVTYRNADKIIVISEDFKANIMAKGVPADKIEVVYNWVDESAVHHVDRKNNILFDRFNIDRSRFYVAYSGNIGFTQNMALLLDVAERLKEYTDIGFIVVGDGAYKDEFIKNIKERELHNIIVIPFQPYEEISNVFSLGDVGLIISKKGVGNNSVPSKTWSYMAAGIPILTSFDIDSELCKLVHDNYCGVCVDANNVDGLVNAILFMKDEELTIYGKNGRIYIEEKLSRTAGTTTYLKVIKSVAERSLYEMR